VAGFALPKAGVKAQPERLIYRFGFCLCHCLCSAHSSPFLLKLIAHRSKVDSQIACIHAPIPTPKLFFTLLLSKNACQAPAPFKNPASQTPPILSRQKKSAH
jgi:hypothetical protein